MRARDQRLFPGIFASREGFRFVKRIRGVVRTHRLPGRYDVEALPALLTAWVARVERALDHDAAPAPHSLAADATDYLKAKASMPSIVARTLHVRRWVEAFPGRARASLTPLEIRTQLETWHAEGMSLAYCNRHRTALMSLFTVLDGQSARNPVRDVPKYHEGDGELHAHPLGLLYRVLACMRPSQTRARLRVMLWTGLPHRILAQLTPAHVNLEQATMRVAPRRKGKGASARTLPLLPGALVAFKDFIAWECFTPIIDGTRRPFSPSSMRASLLRGVAKVNAHRARLDLPPVVIRPYDFRHSFLTFLAQRITDDRALQELALHSSPAQIRRYTEAATSARVRAAVAGLMTGVAGESVTRGVTQAVDIHKT